MPAGKEALALHGINLADYKDRPERPSDGARGLGRGLLDFMEAAPWWRWESEARVRRNRLI